MNCIHCNKETSNPKFCSRSCAAKINNKLHPKRKPENNCLVCGVILSTNWVYCENCTPGKIDYETVTLNDLAFLSCYVRQSKIRDHSRRTYLKSNKTKECAVCKYSKHIHVCHIKAVKDFTLDTLLKDVNSLDNLIGLCPTHHWEFDNNLLEIPIAGTAPTLDDNQSQRAL